jgi:hypothetical protein
MKQGQQSSLPAARYSPPVPRTGSSLAALKMRLLLCLATIFLPCTLAFFGINLGNVLEAPTEGAWAPAAQEYYFEDYVTQGFTRVRVPVRWDKHLGTSPPYAIDAAFLARVRQVVGWGLARNLTIVVNSHHDDWIDSASNFTAQLPRFLALWTQVAAAFAAAPPSLLFEVINEPVSLTLAQLNQLYAAVVPLMRVGNPSRPIYLGGLSWMSPNWILQNPEAVVFPALPSGAADANLRLEVHSYDPYGFCLQSPPSQATWGTPSDLAVVQSAWRGPRPLLSFPPPPPPPRPPLTAPASLLLHIHTHSPEMYTDLAAWGSSHGGRSVYMGEAGCQVAAPNRTDRILWYSTVGAASRAVEGITVWDDDGSWKLYNRVDRTWDEEVLAALFGR